MTRENPLRQLSVLGQSIWLDYIHRELITSGHLRQLIARDGLSGLTSNPAIFSKAILGSTHYADDIRQLLGEGKAPETIYEALSQRDLATAAEEFRALYDKTGARDGYVSLEVNPHLAHDTRGTIAEARRLWAALNLPNAFIKVPATREGLPAIRELISDGININVTLLFGLKRYREVAEAYLAGIEARAAAGLTMEPIASVASFFVSRMDVLVDPLLEARAAQDGRAGERAKQLVGQVAIANAQVAYQIYKEIFGSARFHKLAALGARPQRLLWASTGTKNPAYSDVKYIEALIGPDTINTAPLETIDAYRDHGDPQPRLENDIDQARGVLSALPELGIEMDQVTQTLEDEGVAKFNQPWDQLLAGLSAKAARQRQER